MASLVKVKDHIGDTVSEGVELGRGEQRSVLRRMTGEYIGKYGGGERTYLLCGSTKSKSLGSDRPQPGGLPHLGPKGDVDALK